MPASLFACPDCDLLQRADHVPEGGAARCRRCRAVLWRRRRNTFERTLALALAGLILFVAANAFPFLTLRATGGDTETTLLSSVQGLWSEGMLGLATLVLVTSILAPAAHLAALLYLLLPLGLGRRPWGGRHLLRALQHFETWGMVDVFMLGVLVSLVKLADMAEIVPGIAIWAFAALIPTLAAARVSLDTRAVWERMGGHA